jgi:hypothetical protein
MARFHCAHCLRLAGLLRAFCQNPDPSLSRRIDFDLVGTGLRRKHLINDFYESKEISYGDADLGRGSNCGIER